MKWRCRLGLHKGCIPCRKMTRVSGRPVIYVYSSHCVDCKKSFSGAIAPRPTIWHRSRMMDGWDDIAPGVSGPIQARGK